MAGLKEREKQMLTYMKNEIKQKGYPPTVREMCRALGIKSTSTAHKDLANLEKLGFIRKDPSKPRAIEILDFEEDSGLEARNTHYESPAPVERADVLDIPVVGRIAAGTPILAEQNIEDSFPVPSRYIGKGGDHFMLTVRGDSMVNVGIYDGDYILVRQQKEARNGEIVVAMINDMESEATVKTFYKEADRVRLQPENDTMDPIYVRDVQILGLVKGVFRYFS